MAYNKTKFEDGVTVLKASHLDYIENGIINLETSIPLAAHQIYNQTPQRKSKDEQIKILCFGSSWFLNTWFYLNKITKNLGINAKIHGYYMGHSQFNEWIAFYQNSLTPFAGTESTRQAFQYISENGEDYTSQKHVTGGAFGDQEYRDAWYNDLISEDWDIIAFQQGAHQAPQSDKWDNAGMLVSMIKRHCGPNTVIAFNSTWTPSISSPLLPDDTDGLCDNTLEGQMLWQQMNWNNTKKLMHQTGITNVSPNGAMIYTMRRDTTFNTDQYDLMYDLTHPDNGLTMYGVSCCFYETFIAPFYNISVKNCTWLPDEESQRSPFNNTKFRPINTTQQAKIFEYMRLSLSNRFGFNELGGNIVVNPDYGKVEVDSEGYITMPISHNSLGVGTTGTGRVNISTATTGTRISTASNTTANGIIIGANETLEIKGLRSGNYPLRVDYCYATSSGPNPTEQWDKAAGCANGGDMDNTFPLNADGASDSITITNNYGSDYYFFFVFAGVNKNEVLQASTYTLKYKMVE